MNKKNYYELLNVEPSASLADITEAFNTQLKAINERNAHNKIEELQTIIEAFAILSDEEKRSDYDHFLESGQAIALDEEDSVYKSTSLVERIRFEKTGSDLEERIPQLIEKVDHVLRRVQDHKVRLRYRGKQLGPDIPMGYAIALEALGLLGAGVVRTVVANLGVKTLFDVEVLSHSEEHINKGDDLYQKGELELAEKEYLAALTRHEKNAAACLKLGILKKIQGNKKEAIQWFNKTLNCDPDEEIQKQAQHNLELLGPYN